MLNLVFSVLFFFTAAGLLVASARSDWKGMTIPNEYSLGLVALFVFGSLLPNVVFTGVSFLPGLIGGALVFLVTLILYVGRAMGGGDTKMAGAVSLLVGIGYIDVFLLVMSFAGGFLAIYALLTRKYGRVILPKNPHPDTWLGQLKQGQNKVPYGLAIATGGVAALFAKWLLPHVS